MLWQLQEGSKGSQPYIYIYICTYPFSSKLPSPPLSLTKNTCLPQLLLGLETLNPSQHTTLVSHRQTWWVKSTFPPEVL